MDDSKINVRFLFWILGCNLDTEDINNNLFSKNNLYLVPFQKVLLK